MDWDRLVPPEHSTLFLAVGGGVAGLLLLLLVLRTVRGKRRRSQVDLLARARTRLVGTLQALRKDLQRAQAQSRQVFARLEAEPEHAEVIGHWRKRTRHRMAVRTPDMAALKNLARTLGEDAAPLIDLDGGLRKAGRSLRDYDAGKLDASRTPIATVRQVAKDIQALLVLVNLCLQRYEGS